MTISKALLTASIATVVVAGIATTSAFAWHPKGEIVKKVQNVTTGSALEDADDEKSAVAAKPGDILKYVITIKNAGAPDSKGYNDMAKTVMTDTLPAGVELVSNPATRTVTENFGLVKPGKTVTKEITVKVTAKEDGVIKNTACFTGDSTVNDAPQKGCNPAVVTVTVPEEPETPTTPETPETPEVPTTPETPETPETPKTPETPAELPKTGAAETALLSAFGLGALYFAAHRYVASRRDLANSLLNR